MLHAPAVEAVAAAHNTSTATVALRWVVQQGLPFVTSSTDAGYDLEDLAAAANGSSSGAVVLSAAEMAALAAV